MTEVVYRVTSDNDAPADLILESANDIAETVEMIDDHCDEEKTEHTLYTHQLLIVDSENEEYILAEGYTEEENG